jgi:hypothetical protein
MNGQAAVTYLREEPTTRAAPNTTVESRAQRNAFGDKAPKKRKVRAEN